MNEESHLDKTTSLRESHLEIGAVFDDFFGWRMVRSYGNPSEEQGAVRQAAGIVDLSFCGAISVAGGEGATFLQGMVTNDVLGLEKGSGMRAAFLSGHGKIRALARIYSRGDGQYLIVTDPQTHGLILDFILPFNYAGDFLAADVSSEYKMLSVQGPASPQVMREVCFEPILEMEEHQWIQTLIAGHSVMVVRSDRIGQGGYDLLMPAESLGDVWDFVLLKGKFHGLTPFGVEALHNLGLEAAIPIHGIDLDDGNMMLESGLDDAISFTKGCYTGQEAVAMATYRGHVSKRLAFLKVEGDEVPPPGATLAKNGKRVGHITRAARSPAIGSIVALGMVKYGFFEPGTVLDVDCSGGSEKAVVSVSSFRSGGELKSV